MPEESVESGAEVRSGQALCGRRTAVALGGALLVGLSTAAITATFDRGERSTLETVVQPETALGDTARFDLDEDLKPGDVVGQHEGRDLLLVSQDKTKVPDVAMRKAGMESGGTLTLYRFADQPGADAMLFLKLDPGEFVQVRPRR